MGQNDESFTPPPLYRLRSAAKPPRHHTRVYQFPPPRLPRNSPKTKRPPHRRPGHSRQPHKRLPRPHSPGLDPHPSPPPPQHLPRQRPTSGRTAHCHHQHPGRPTHPLVTLALTTQRFAHSDLGQAGPASHRTTDRSVPDAIVRPGSISAGADSGFDEWTASVTACRQPV